MTTLTDRYVWAVQRSLPEAKRADIDAELRGSIADAIDAKQDAGAAPAAAEREAILELGDPYRLASGYADRPLQLIGPKVFPDYIRLLKVLYVIVLPIVFGAILLGQLLGKPDSIGGAIGTTIGAIIAVAAHFGFWTTLVFALIERSPQYQAAAWNPDTLPQVPAPTHVRLSDTIASGVWFGFAIGGVIWAQFISLFRDADGAVIPVFDPALQTFWLPFFLGLALAGFALQLVAYRMRRWTFALAGVNALITLAYIVPALWLLLSGHLMNPAFLDRTGIGSLFEPDGVVTIVVVIVFLVIAIGSSVEDFRRAARHRGRPGQAV